MEFIDFFSGIGGFRLGLELAGHKCIGYCEKDKFAVKSYRAMFNTEGEWYRDDITTIKSEEIPYADIWCFGFPCSDIAICGKQRGIRGERSGLYFELTKLLKSKEEKDKPSYLLIENVKNLLSINDSWDYLEVLIELDEAGYDAVWQVLNSKDFGVPQNRERVFIVANLRSRGRRKILPVSGENTAALKQIIGGMQGYRVYDPDGISTTLIGNAGGIGAKTGLYCVGNVNPSGRGMDGNVYSTEGLAPTITTNKGVGSKIFIDQSAIKPKLTETSRCITARYTAGIVNRTAANSGVLEARAVITPERENKRQNGRRIKNADEPMFTLTSSDKQGVAINHNSSYRIRRLTPKECFRLQGFSDELFEKARSVNSDSQLYRQAGNAVSVPVAYAVAKTLPNE